MPSPFLVFVFPVLFLRFSALIFCFHSFSSRPLLHLSLFRLAIVCPYPLSECRYGLSDCASVIVDSSLLSSTNPYHRGEQLSVLRFDVPPPGAALILKHGTGFQMKGTVSDCINKFRSCCAVRGPPATREWERRVTRKRCCGSKRVV